MRGSSERSVSPSDHSPETPPDMSHIFPIPASFGLARSNSLPVQNHPTHLELPTRKKKFEFHDSGSDLRWALEQADIEQLQAEAASASLTLAAELDSPQMQAPGTATRSSSVENLPLSARQDSSYPYLTIGPGTWPPQEYTASAYSLRTASRLGLEKPPHQERHEQEATQTPHSPCISAGPSSSPGVPAGGRNSGQSSRSSPISIAYSSVRSAPWAVRADDPARFQPDRRSLSLRSKSHRRVSFSSSQRRRRKAQREQDRLTVAFLAYDEWKDEVRSRNSSPQVPGSPGASGHQQENGIQKMDWALLGALHVQKRIHDGEKRGKAVRSRTKHLGLLGSLRHLDGMFKTKVRGIISGWVLF